MRPRGRLSLARSGRDGEPHRLEGAVTVAEQLAPVRDAHVRVEAGLAQRERVEGGEGGVVAAELDERVADERERTRRIWRERPRPPREHERAAKVVSRQRERGEPLRRRGVARVELQRLSERRLRAGQVRRVGRLAGALLVLEPERHEGAPVGRKRRCGRLLPAEGPAEEQDGGGERRHRPSCREPGSAHVSYPRCGVARYGNDVMNGFSFASTPSPSRLFGVRFAFPPQKPKPSTIGPTTVP